MADVDVALRWADGLRFEGGRPDGPQIMLDGNKDSALSPVEALLLSLAGCIAADLIDIAGKMRVPLERLTASATADRAEQPPRRFTGAALRFAASGVAPANEAKLQRALDLSRETYCSVLHTLRPDLAVEMTLVFE